MRASIQELIPFVVIGINTCFTQGVSHGFENCIATFISVLVYAFEAIHIAHCDSLPRSPSRQKPADSAVRSLQK